MTDLTELHEKYELIRKHEGQNNLNYAIMHADGKVSLCPNKMCWAPIYEGGTVASNEEFKRHTPYDLGCYGYLTSSAPFSYIKSTIKYKKSITKGKISYLKAVKELFEHYDCLLVKDSFKNRRENGFVIKLEGAPVTKEQLGAFLVFYRNLGEQQFHYMFNALRQEGFSFEEAAIWSCFVNKEGNTCTLNRGWHTVFSTGANTNIATITAMLKGASPFHLDTATEPLEPSNNYRWELYTTYLNGSERDASKRLFLVTGYQPTFTNFLAIAKGIKNA